jgi:hypothetical protein
MSLMIAEDISSILETEEENITKNIKDSIKDNSCKSFVVSKHYANIEDLKRDNGRTIYFDKKYDNTLYSILDDFEKEQMRMLPEDFYDFLVNKIINKYKYSLEEAKYLTETLIDGMKKIIEGNIAVLYNSINGKLIYYKRHNNRWELDESITENLITDNQNMLCNFQTNCIEVEKKYGDSIKKRKIVYKLISQAFILTGS